MRHGNPEINSGVWVFFPFSIPPHTYADRIGVFPCGNFPLIVVHFPDADDDDESSDDADVLHASISMPAGLRRSLSIIRKGYQTDLWIWVMLKW